MLETQIGMARKGLFDTNMTSIGLTLGLDNMGRPSVYINQRSAVHPKSNGTLLSQDVCLTGLSKTPILYTNLSKTSSLQETAQSVFSEGEPLAHEHSYFKESLGDEAGTGGGIHSSTQKGRAVFLTASPNVFIEGKRAVRSQDLMTSNEKNTPAAPLIQE